MALNWINPEDYSFNCLLLLERFQIRLMLDSCGWNVSNEEWQKNMGIALNANPVVMWYLKNRCPERSSLVDKIAAENPEGTGSVENRKAEVYVMASIEDFVVYTTPEVMAEKCDFIKGWNKERLFAMADFTDKIVLDVGTGSGRLTFAACEKAVMVYASEPVGSLCGTKSKMMGSRTSEFWMD